MQVACPHAADNEKRNRPFIQHEIKTRSHIEHGQKQQRRAASLSIASWCCLCQVALGHVEAELNLIRLFFFLVCVPSSCLVFFVQLSLSSRAECHERILGDFFRPQVAALGLAGNPVGTVTNWSSTPPSPFPLASLQLQCQKQNEKFAEILHATRAAPISKDLGHELAASVSRARHWGVSAPLLTLVWRAFCDLLAIGYSAFFRQRQRGLLISQSQKHFLAFTDDSAESNLYAR